MTDRYDNPHCIPGAAVGVREAVDRAGGPVPEKDTDRAAETSRAPARAATASARSVGRKWRTLSDSDAPTAPARIAGRG
jgi:hypothetical protein